MTEIILEYSLYEMRFIDQISLSLSAYVCCSGAFGATIQSAGPV